jgi:uncharacterized protein YecT (DUF1311 family)
VQFVGYQFYNHNAEIQGVKMQKLALLFGLMVLATGLSVRAQDVAAGCQGDNLEFTECAGKRAIALDRLQDRIYHTVMDALISGGDDAELLANGFGLLRGTLPKSQQQWTRYRHSQCEVVSSLNAGVSGAAVLQTQCAYELTRERIKFLRHIMDVVRDQSKLCKTDKAKCALPTDPA